MEIAGLPLHPLVVHAVVVLAPLAAGLGVAYAAVPGWRWLLRWPLVVLTGVALVAAVVATASGEALLEARPALAGLPTIAEHEEAGERVRAVVAAFALVVLAAAWYLGGPSPLESRKGARPRRGPLEPPLAGLLALASLGVVVTVVLAGDSGARAVWG